MHSSLGYKNARSIEEGEPEDKENDAEEQKKREVIAGMWKATVKVTGETETRWESLRAVSTMFWQF